MPRLLLEEKKAEEQETSDSGEKEHKKSKVVRKSFPDADRS